MGFKARLSGGSGPPPLCPTPAVSHLGYRHCLSYHPSHLICSILSPSISSKLENKTKQQQTPSRFPIVCTLPTNHQTHRPPPTTHHPKYTDPLERRRHSSIHCSRQCHLPSPSPARAAPARASPSCPRALPWPLKRTVTPLQRPPNP